MARLELPYESDAGSAAEGGSADALFELGIMYASGREGHANLVMAHKWFNLSALRGNRAALNHRKEIAEEMSRAEISVAQKLAREYLRK